MVIKNFENKIINFKNSNQSTLKMALTYPKKLLSNIPKDETQNRRVAGPLYNDRAARSKRKCAIMRNQAQSGAIKCAVLIFDDRALIAH